MSERFKYSLNGVYRCENFAQHLAENTFPRVPIGTGGEITGWYIILRICIIDNQTYVYPFIFCYDKPRVKLHSFFNILGKDGKSNFSVFGDIVLGRELGLYGIKMNILDVLNEKNGYLDNGTLSIEYGIHIDGLQWVDGIWKFNFDEKLFNLNDGLTINYLYLKDRPLKVFYCHKQLLRFHSPHFQNQITNLISRETGKWLNEGCLQIAHGVRTPVDRCSMRIAIIAHNNKLRNVVQYVDQQLVQDDWCPPKTTSSHIILIKICIKSGLRHYLAHLVKHFKRSKDLKKVIQKLGIEKMSGEAMKTFMAKIFKLNT